MFKANFFLLTFLICFESVALDINLDVEKYVLPNGLTVILHEDRTSGLVSYHTWFKVGSRDEDPSFTGLAHLFEHMMFKGAARYTGKEYEELLRTNGGTNNAFYFS